MKNTGFDSIIAFSMILVTVNCQTQDDAGLKERKKELKCLLNCGGDRLCYAMDIFYHTVDANDGCHTQRHSDPQMHPSADTKSTLTLGMIYEVQLTDEYQSVQNEIIKRWHKTITRCDDLRNRKHYGSGVYYIPTIIKQIIPVYCEVDEDGHFWTWIQHRFNGSVDFYRNWEEYKNGFGNINGEFWLGNEIIHELTKDGNQMIRFDLYDGSSMKRADYNMFKVASEEDGFKLDCSGFSGTAMDRFSYQCGQKFSTFDKDMDLHDDNCGSYFKAGWWYHSCHRTNLNGKFYSQTTNSKFGMSWYDVNRKYRTMIKTTMKIRKFSAV